MSDSRFLGLRLNSKIYEAKDPDNAKKGLDEQIPSLYIDLTFNKMTNSNPKPKQIANKRRHAFLLTFFSPESTYQVVMINGYVLVKQFNKSNTSWEVAIHTKEGWKKIQEWKNNQAVLV